MKLSSLIKFSLLILILLQSQFQQAQIRYEIKMDRPDVDDLFNPVVCDSNGNAYVGYGFELSNTNFPSGISYLYKIDPDGDTILLNYQKPDTIISFEPIIDEEENILLVDEGFKLDSIGYLSNKFHVFIKLTPTQDILWQKCFHLDSDSSQTWTSIFAESNWDSYVHASVVQNMNTGGFSMYSFEISKEGDSLNYYLHEEALLGFLYSYTLSPFDSSIIEYHLSMASSGNNAGCGRLQLDDSLHFISIEPYPGQYYQLPFYTMRFADGGYLSAGCYGFGSDYIQVRIMDTSLNIMKSINLCYNENETVPAWSKCVDYHYPDRIFVSGISPYYSNYMANYIYIACLDNNLNLIHEEYIGGDGYYDVISIAASPDGGVIIAGGYTDVAIQPLQKDGYLIKLDSMMFVGLPDDQYDIRRNAFLLTPNPAHDHLTVSSNVIDYHFELIDICGQIKYQSSCHDSKLNVDVSLLPPGLYIWKATFNYQSVTGKLLIH